MTKMSYEKQLKELGIVLPEPPKPVGAYRPVIISGSTAFLSGQISKSADGRILTGKIGRDLNLEEGKLAAHAAALNVVSLIRNAIGFDRFSRLLRITGFVQCDPSFSDIHLVMNGASDLFEQIFGPNGLHARSAVGMASLPLNAAVELEATVELNSGFPSPLL